MSHLVKEGIAIVTKAVELDAQGKLAASLPYYENANEKFREALKTLPAESRTRAATTAKLAEYENRVREIHDIVGSTSTQQLLDSGFPTLPTFANAAPSAPAPTQTFDSPLNNERKISTLRPSRSKNLESRPAMNRQRSLSGGSWQQMHQSRKSNQPLSNPALDEFESINNRLNNAKRTLNSAMNADRKKDWDEALTLYERGLEQMMSLLQEAEGDEHVQLRKWLGENIRKHLSRAEFIKASLIEQRAPWTGTRAIAKADDAWNEGRYDEALPLYEAALDQLRADDIPPEPEQLVRCAERIELLRDRQANDGHFERPIPLGHKPGDVYVDPAPAPSKWNRFKHKAAKEKKKLKYALEDLDL